MTIFSKQFFSAQRLAIGVGLLAVGGGLGAATALTTRPSVTMAPAIPVSIASLATRQTPWLGDEIVTVRGRVAEAYGNDFILADGSGRILVDAGRHGGDSGLFALNQTVTVQGHFDHDAIRAMFLVGADGRVTALGPHGRHGGRPPHGPDDRLAEGRPVPPAAPAPEGAPVPAPAHP